jgi:hypothetical protein
MNILIMAVPREEVTQILHDGAFDTLQLDEDYVVRGIRIFTKKSPRRFYNREQLNTNLTYLVFH